VLPAFSSFFLRVLGVLGGSKKHIPCAGGFTSAGFNSSARIRDIRGQIRYWQIAARKKTGELEESSPASSVRRGSHATQNAER
jgi:hypothetical protein